MYSGLNIKRVKVRVKDGGVCHFSIWLALCRIIPLFLVAANLLVSCTNNESTTELFGDKDAVIRFQITADIPKDATTRSVDEDQINDLHVLVYNSDGELTGKSYATFSGTTYAISVLARSGTGCKIYAIANTASSTLFDGAVAGSETKLKAMITNLATWSTLNNTSGMVYLPMSGSTTADIAAGSTSLQGGITVKRLAAKVTLNVGIVAGSGVSISGYRIYGVPARSYYVAHPLSTEDQTIDSQSIRAEDASLPANSGDWINSGFVSLSNVTSFSTSFYMYENRAGVNTQITAQNQKVNSNVPDSAAYVMIYGKATGYRSLSWRIYLGANNTSNFNIKRNNQYTCTITLKPNDSDTRITYKKSGTVWAGSNIYWDGTKLTFDTETSYANNTKQGVSFRWGSLVGVSLSSTYVTYTPTYNSTTPSNSSWTQGSTSYSSITHFTDNLANGSQTNIFLNDAAQNTDANYTAYKGDICQYLSKTQPLLGSWRMPTVKEYNSAGLAHNTSVSWTNSTVPWASFGSFAAQISNVNAQGTISIPSGGTYTVNGSSSFPASGCRSPDGTLLNVGQSGYYWSSSAYSSTEGYYLYFNINNVAPAYSYNGQSGHLVRCVQN